MDDKQLDQNCSTDLTPTMQAGQDSEGGGKHRTNVYAACSGGVVVVVLGDLVTLEAFWKGLERSTQLFIMNLAIARN